MELLFKLRRRFLIDLKNRCKATFSNPYESVYPMGVWSGILNALDSNSPHAVTSLLDAARWHREGVEYLFHLKEEGGQPHAWPTQELSDNMQGYLPDGTLAPTNSDTARLNWWILHPEKVKNLKAGVKATDIKCTWQPGLRAAIDAAMEHMRRELRAKGLEPEW